MAWRVSRRLFHGNPGREGRTPSHLGDAPSSKRGRPGVLLGARGLLLGGPSSELGECTSVGRAWVPELVVCLKLLGPCPKKTGARVFELGACRELAPGRSVGCEPLSQVARALPGACSTSRG
jgi:hypothetical protein